MEYIFFVVLGSLYTNIIILSHLAVSDATFVTTYNLCSLEVSLIIEVYLHFFA